MKYLYSCLAGIALFFIWPMDLDILSDPYSTVLEGRNGQLLSAQIASDGQWRFPIMDELPQNFIDCITAYEDQRFYMHLGVDPIALGRAIRQNVKAGKVVSGASTITMQLVRMSRRNRPRVMMQKLIETVLAIKLELHYSKADILKMYASHAPFGGNVIGLQAASWKYYNKHMDYLSWAQMATLAVLPNAPSLVRLDRNSDRLLEKRNFLLHKLYELGKLSAIDLELALEEELDYDKYALPRSAPHLLEFAKKQNKSGRVRTTIDIDIQQGVNNVLNYHHDNLKQNEIHNAAVLVLDTRTSEVIAYAGNVPATRQESSVDMIQAKRSSGSILKPFLYASMLDDGIITPDAFVKDTPIFIDGFSPSNYDRSYSGIVPFSEALSRSLNVPFVLQLQKYGVEKFRRSLNHIGLSSVAQHGDHYGLSLILGGAEVTLSELTETYAQMGSQLLDYDTNQGKYSTPIMDGLYYDKEGELAISKTIAHEPIVSFRASSIYHAFEAMQKLYRPDQSGNWELFTSSRKVAWKTGTSFGHRDAWAVGVTPDYTIGVWVGNADGEGRDEIIGVSTAGKLMFSVLDLLPEESPWFTVPYDDMEQMDICDATGMLPSVHCKSRKKIWLGKPCIGSKVCSYHETIWTDRDGEWSVDRSCYPSDLSIQSSILKLPPLVSKYYRGDMNAVSVVPPLHPDCQNHYIESTDMEMIYPFPDERIFIPRDFNDDKQKIIAQIEHADPQAEVFWYLNGDYLGMTKDFHSMSILSAAGAYVLHCTDQRGLDIMRRFEIVGE